MTGDRGWVAEDDCSNCESGPLPLPCGLCGAGFAVSKRLGGWGELGRKAGGGAGSMMGEELGRKAGGGREYDGGEPVGGLQEPPCYLGPLPHARKFHGGQSPL